MPEQTQVQSDTTKDTQTETEVEQTQTENKDSKNSNGEDSGPLDNLDSAGLKDWGRRQAADAAKYRKSNAVLKKQIEDEQNGRLKEQGKFKEMYELEKGKNEKLEGGLRRGFVRSQVKSQLLKLGCNPDLVDKAIKHADVKSIETDPETYQGNAEQVIFEAKRVKDEVPVFFGNKFVEAKDGTPGSTAAPKKSIKEMSDKELDVAYADALST